MIIQKVKQSLVMDRVVPDYVIQEFPLFVEFVRAYFRQQEQAGQTLDKMARFLSNKDINTVTDPNARIQIIKTFIDSIPKNLEVDYALLIQNIKSFYATKGTESSIQTLVYLMSNSRKPNTVFVRYTGDEDLLVGQIGTGTNSGAIAEIIRATRVSPTSELVSLSVTYTPESKGRFFTSSDELVVDGDTIELLVEDFNVEIFYPKNFILRSSDGEQITETRIRIRLQIDQYVDYTGKQFTTTSGNSGRIDRQSFRVFRDSNYDYYDVVLSFSINVGWTQSEQLFIESNLIDTTTVIGSVAIQNSGTGYAIGDVFSVLRSGIKVGEVIVTDIRKNRVTSVDVLSGGAGYDIGDEFRFLYEDGYYGGGYVAGVNSGAITTIQVTHSRPLSGEIPEIEFLNGNNSASLNPVGSAIGGIEKLVPTDPGFAITGTEVVQIPVRGGNVINAAMTVVPTTIYMTVPKFKDERGQPSCSYRLQDNNYWQDYSYVVKTTRQSGYEDYKDVYKKTVHPAGTKVFFEYTNTGRIPNGEVKMGLVDSDKTIEKTIPLHQIIRYVEDVQIGDIERIKDTNPFHVFVHPFLFNRPDLKEVFQSWMFFPSETTTLDEIEDQIVHRWTMAPEFHPTEITLETI